MSKRYIPKTMAEVQGLGLSQELRERIMNKLLGKVKDHPDISPEVKAKMIWKYRFGVE